MKADQLIYTACGKERTGAFSVWSLSGGVQKTESDEIIKVMSYQKPIDAPFNPTDDEIKTLFPKKYGYFALTSGRYCVAKTTYLGRVYSDLDKRSGNFIIHAFIFEKNKDFYPFSIFDSDIFKEELTYKEWHDDPVPDFLPSVDIDFKPVHDVNTVKKFLQNGGDKDALYSLVQAVINSLNSDNVVTFNAEYNTQKEIYKILGDLLPETMCSDVTFITDYLTSMEYSLQTMGFVPVKIRNLKPDTISGNLYDYASEIEQGHYGFNFLENKFVHVNRGGYVNDISLMIDDGENISNVLIYVKNISNLISSENISIEDAVKIYHFISNEFNWFANVNELTSGMNLSKSMKFTSKHADIDVLYSYLKNNNLVTLSPDVKDVISFVYDNTDNDNKNDIMITLFNDLPKSLPIGQSDSASYINNVNNSFPFKIRNVVENLLKVPGGIKTASAKKEMAVVLFSGLREKFVESNANDQFVKKELSDMFADALIRKDVARVALYQKDFLLLPRSMQYEIVLNVSGLNGEKAIICDRNQFEYDMYLMSVIPSRDDKLKFIELILRNNYKESEFIPLYYIIYKNSNDKPLFNEVEQKLSKEELFKDFFCKKAAYEFSNAEKINSKLIDSYFDKYFTKGYDTGIFLKKYKEYVNGISTTAELLRELFYRFMGLSSLEKNDKTLEVIKFIETKIYALDIKDIMSLNNNDIDKIKDVFSVLNKFDMADKKYYLYLTVWRLQGKNANERLNDVINSGKIYNLISDDNNIKSGLNLFANNYMFIAINTFYSLFKSENSRDALFTNLFEPLVVSVNNCFNCFKNAFDIINNENIYNQFISFVIYYSYNNQVNSFVQSLRNFIDDSLVSMDSKDYNKLFKTINAILAKDKNVSKDAIINVTKFEESFKRNHEEFKDTNKKPFNVVVLGNYGVGRTNYFGVLINEIKEKMESGFNSTFNTPPDSLELTQYYKTHFYNTLYVQKKAIQDENKKTPCLNFSLRLLGKSLFGKNIVKNVFTVSTSKDAGRIKEMAYESAFKEYVTKAGGLVLLIDPMQLPLIRDELSGKIELPLKESNPFAPLETIIKMFSDNQLVNKKGIINIPVAVVFTKMDVLYRFRILKEDTILMTNVDHAERRGFILSDYNCATSEIEQLLDNADPEHKLKELLNSFVSHAVFGVSSLGEIPAQSGALNKGPNPVRVLDPMLWMLAQKKYIPTIKK